MERGGSLPHSQESQPNQSIPLPITLLTGTACFLPGRAKDLSAPRYIAVVKLEHHSGLIKQFISWRDVVAHQRVI